MRFVPNCLHSVEKQSTTPATPRSTAAASVAMTTSLLMIASLGRLYSSRSLLHKTTAIPLLTIATGRLQLLRVRRRMPVHKVVYIQPFCILMWPGLVYLLKVASF